MYESSLVYILNSSLGRVGRQGIMLAGVNSLLLLDSNLSSLEAASFMVRAAREEVTIVNNLFQSDPLGRGQKHKKRIFRFKKIHYSKVSLMTILQCRLL